MSSSAPTSQKKMDEIKKYILPTVLAIFDKFHFYNKYGLSRDIWSVLFLVRPDHFLTRTNISNIFCPAMF